MDRRAFLKCVAVAAGAAVLDGASAPQRGVAVIRGLKLARFHEPPEMWVHVSGFSDPARNGMFRVRSIGEAMGTAERIADVADANIVYEIVGRPPYVRA